MRLDVQPLIVESPIGSKGSYATWSAICRRDRLFADKEVHQKASSTFKGVPRVCLRIRAAVSPQNRARMYVAYSQELTFFFSTAYASLLNKHTADSAIFSRPRGAGILVRPHPTCIPRFPSSLLPTCRALPSSPPRYPYYQTAPPGYFKKQFSLNRDCNALRGQLGH